MQEIKRIVKTAGGRLDAGEDEDMDDVIDHALDNDGSNMHIN